MDSESITNENDYYDCIDRAQRIETEDKSLFCPNFYFVFYAEFELNLNRYFTQNPLERWSLLFVDYNFMPPIYLNASSSSSIQVFFSQPNILTILHNAKIKYCCTNCSYEWTSARGRAIFQAEIPETNKYNILFGYLFSQQCQQCLRDIQPCWYVDETTRIMKNICRILIEQFYSNRQFVSIENVQENLMQRTSDMRHRHHRHLCLACQHGSCYR